MIAAFFFFVLLPNGRGCRGGGADSANVGGDFPTGSYQNCREEIGGINAKACIVYDTISGEITVKRL
jgi:hypothetical protein